MEEMKIVVREIKDLKPADYNPRELTPEQHKHLKASLTEFGIVDPIVINTHPKRKDIIIGGHQRTKVWQEIGHTTIPTVEEHLTLKKERELNVRLNKNSGQFSWDKLSDGFQEQELLEWGFSEDEMKFPVEIPEAEEDDYQVPETVKTDIVLGDLIEIGEHRLLCGDSTDSDLVAKLMDGKKADMVFTDPPYNVGFNGRSGQHEVMENDNLSDVDFNSLIDGMVSIIHLLDPSSYYIWCNWKFYGLLQDKLEFKSCIVWAKNVFGMGNGYRHQHEFCLHYGDIDKGINDESDLWEVKKDTNYKHPTQKPVQLSERALKNHKEAKIVVDLFSGSGSTFSGAHQLNRKCYGMELDPKYCQVIVDRMMKLDESITVKINGKAYNG